MKDNNSVQIIACGVLAVDLKKIAAELGTDIRHKYLPGGLHNEPTKLRLQLQEAIDKTSDQGGVGRIAVGYGVCGRGTVGIQARDIPVAIPRVHDCIALFLGSDDAYRQEFAKYPGTFYYSAGWCDEKVQPRADKDPEAWMIDKTVTLAELTEQYGPVHAQEIFAFLSSWQQNYQRAVYIDTGVKSKGWYERQARDMADKYGWSFDRLQGDPSLLTKLLTTDESDDEILIIPPHHFSTFDPIEGRMTAVPEQQGHHLPGALAARTVSVIGADDEPGREAAPVRLGLGVDAGGTYTDAVIYDLQTDEVLGKHKALTTKWDFTVGIKGALDGLDAEALTKVDLVAVSTTMATNAIVEGDGQLVGLLLMTPFGLTKDNPIAHRPMELIDGRLEITGLEIQPVDPDQVRRVARRMVDDNKVGAFAVSGFGGSINPGHELLVKSILMEETGLDVTCGHELSDRLDFKTRADTAVLNARIIPRLSKLIRELQSVLSGLGIEAPVVVVKGDGSLISSVMAAERPVETIMSGPAASVAGARHLTGRDDAVVVDVGGTTTDTAALKKGLVRVLESGSTVGGVRTHVKALEMRTTGLGGDSAIVWDEDKFLIGPRRVAPMAWLGAKAEGLDMALRFVEHRLDRFRTGTAPMQMLTATGHSDGLALTDIEKRILDLVRQRPHSLDELAQRTESGYWRLLPLARLEENYMVQRCGLTPTDLLHVKGLFQRWDSEVSRRMIRLTGRLLSLNDDHLVELLLDKAIHRLATELLKKQLDELTVADELDNCAVCNALIGNMLNGGDPSFTVKVELHHPVIGIGAPAPFFVPRAGEILGAEVIMPRHADVANAIGAITSNVRIQKRVCIKPVESGEFIIEGLAGETVFSEFEAANQWAEDELKKMVVSQGRLAGTGADKMELEVQDNVIETATGSQLFMGRTMTARITGRPDMLPSH